MRRRQRKKFFVDPKVQGAVVRRAIVYVLLVVCATSLISALTISITEGPIGAAALVAQLWSRSALSLLASLFLVPVVVIDCVRLSNRFAGPMLRLRRSMKEAAEGKDVQPVKLRKGDFWFDFAEDFNRFVAANQGAVAAPRNCPQPAAASEEACVPA